jgi:D-sedoheptulose 7-phosphate isomerase
MKRLSDWLDEYRARQIALCEALPVGRVAEVVGLLQQACERDAQIFVFGNGGSAANASHFATDLGKGASDKWPRRFRVLSLNDNASWMTAIGNDYSYEDVFVRQLENYARAGDLALTMSVSGNSPNLVKAIAWARENGVATVALVGGQGGKLAEVAEHVIVVPDGHYGRVEDAHMTICHMLCYAFIEQTVAPEARP